MAAAGCLLIKDQLLCSICLDVFTDPVSTPCGHNFCKNCIAEPVDIDVPFQCPVCMKMFYPKPDLQVNTLVSEMVDAFRRSQQQPARQEEVPHGVKPMALFLCLLCISFLFGCMKPSRPLEEVSEGAKLVKIEAEIQQTIEEIRLKIEELKHSVELSKEDADREMADSVQVFAALKESAERSEAKLMETIRQKQRTTELQAEGFIKKLEQDLRELKKRRTEVELLSVVQLNKTLSEEMMEKLPKMLARAELRRVQSYSVDVTLNPDTAHPHLILSDDGKQVTLGDEKKNVPDNPERFSYCVCVLGKQSFSSGRFYFEVQVKGKTEWTLGVARESINRKAQIILKPQNGFWTVWLRNGNEYKAKAGPDVPLYLQSGPEKVGVFVDYEEGLVSFYDVSAEALIYSFTGCSFTEKLYPYFCPGLNDNGINSAPLIITPID